MHIDNDVLRKQESHNKAYGMPSDQSTWLIAIPQDGDAEGTLQELHSKLAAQSRAGHSLSQLPIPAFKVRVSDSHFSTC